MAWRRQRFIKQDTNYIAIRKKKCAITLKLRTSVHQMSA